MKKIQVTSEIKPLKRVLVHRPGEELLNLTPSTLEELLFDDIPDLKLAQEEHDRFTNIMRDNGVEVVYLEDLMTETLDANEGLRETFLEQYLSETGCEDKEILAKAKEYLEKIEDTKEFVEKTMAGLTLKELGLFTEEDLHEMVVGQSYLAINPMPNLYFTRDPFSTIGNGVSINTMYSVTRSRETIYADYIFNHHKEYKGTRNYYGRGKKYHIEGGDILNINKNLLMIGISQRTQLAAIKDLAHKILFDDEAKIEEIIAINIPNERAYMHLDTVFTQIDYDTFTYHPGIISTFHAIKFSK
ncbi:MAG: arginine deiminase family protein, partial [Intestinibacter bartlettii]|uniref:arginine deiminase n=1 Tax=Intestinibacter bartlettii TaxID=261299 RepID=UPI00290A88B3